jgi:hypothetical protein
MSAFENSDSEQSRTVISQPCSEACVGFKRLADHTWSDYGLCTNPISRYCGFPVQLDRECKNFKPSGSEATDHL